MSLWLCETVWPKHGWAAWGGARVGNGGCERELVRLRTKGCRVSY